MFTRNARRAVFLAFGAYLSVFGGCLPENYFALTARQVAVSLANGLVGVAVAPALDLVGAGFGGVQP